MDPTKIKTLELFEVKGKFTFVKRVIGLCLTFILLSNGLLYSQIISDNIDDYPDGATTLPSGRILLPSVHLKENTNYPIPLLVTLPYTFTITYTNGGCSNITNNHSVTNINNVITILVNKKCLTSADNHLDFGITVTKDLASQSKDFRVPIIRDSVKVVLTLDISGSMSLDVDGGTGTRIQALKDAVNMFVPKLEAFQQEGDSLGLTYYSSILYQPELTYFPKKFVKITSIYEPVLANYASYKVQNDLTPRVPLQMTAMASGLLNAKSKLLLNKNKTPNTKRMVFLFTDGLQNYGPQVNSDGNSINNGIDSLNNKSSFPKDSIRYYTIATWGAGLAPEILSNIATSSGGEALHVVQTTPTLTEWFSIQFCNMLADGSPQIVFKRYDTSLSDSSTYSFNLNENISKLLIELSGESVSNLVISVKKNNVDITSKAKPRLDNLKMLTFNFPIDGNPKISSGGKWEVTLTGQTQDPFNIIAFADDHLLKYKCGLDKSIYTVGDTIHFSTKLTYAGNPLTGTGNRVNAILLKPGDDIGQLLSTYKTPVIDSTVDMTSAANEKFQQLMANDTSFYNALLASEQKVDLTDIGNGVYKGYYKKTELAGIYNVIFIINGELNGVGKFERTTIVSSVVKFGQVVEAKPDVVDTIPPSGSTASVGKVNNSLILKIRPKNKFGYYMGPGFGSTIKVAINPSKKQSSTSLKQLKSNSLEREPYVKEIKDGLDGCYYIVLANVPSGSNPSIQISVRGEIVYEGKASPIPFWVYILVILLILILLLMRFFKTKSSSIYNILVWVLTIVLLLIMLLQYLGIFKLF
ncbi:MAG: VWA domain-containing protein [Bacteroidales bacterium]|nr:MAG: VWA domain-containing protein [Bacteroidales bacterium]